MPGVDTTGKAALAKAVKPVAWILFLDVVGDQIRVTTGPTTTFASTGDSDLDGNTFTQFAQNWLNVSDVANSDSGSDTVTITLSGILSLEATLLAAIGDPTKWQGRSCRLWFQIYDETGTTPQGAVVPFYTGYASAVSLMPSPATQEIQLSVENWLAAFNQPSNRSYGNQKDYDASDTSFAATLAAANGSMRGGIGVHAGGSSSTGGGGSNVGSFGGAYGSGTYDNLQTVIKKA